MCRLILPGRARGHGRRELGREDVLEVSLSGGQVDRDLTGLVVRDDAADGALLRLPVLSRADDAAEEAHTRRVDLEVTLNGRLEVARLDGLAVGVLQPLAQRERVRLPVGRDLWQILCEIRNDRRAGRAADVLVAEQRQVDVPHHAPAFDRVRETRVEVVDTAVLRNSEDWERLAARARRRGVAPAGRGGRRLLAAASAS